MQNHDDIDGLIDEIEHIRTSLSDSLLDNVFREEAMQEFVNRHAGPIIRLLEELRQWREREAASGGSALVAKGTHRVIVEGFSDKNASAALSDALDKAAHYFSEQHDVSVTLQELVELPKGGHRATMEIHLTPLTFRNKAELVSPDVELKRIENNNYEKRKKTQEEALDHMIFEHFSGSKGKPARDIPDYFVININDAHLMNFMIENQFLRAGNPQAPHPFDPDLKQLLVRVLRRDNELEPS